MRNKSRKNRDSFFNESLRELEMLQEESSNHDDTQTSLDYTIISPNDEYYSTIENIKRYERDILFHIVSTYLTNKKSYKPPMYLAIEGPPGEGKTCQSIATCIQHGVTVIYCSGSQLSGSHEKASIMALEKIYQEAVQKKQSGEYVAIIIDDFHLSNVNTDPTVKKTINATLLTGYMMNLTEKEMSQYIPIILTGNDFSNVYAPLLRSGRANLIKWSIKPEERQHLVKKICSEFATLSDEELSSFLEATIGASIADYVQLINDYHKENLTEIIDTIDVIDKPTLQRIESQFTNKIKTCNLQKLLELAHRRGIIKPSTI